MIFRKEDGYSMSYAQIPLGIFMPSKLLCGNGHQSSLPSTLYQTQCQSDIFSHFLAYARKGFLASVVTEKF